MSNTKRLEYLRQQLKNENMSIEELLELLSLKEYINAEDTELLEAAGVPEGYIAIDRESEIDNLIMWISECGREREAEKEMMKEDLKTLMSWNCRLIYSSGSTNDYREIED